MQILALESSTAKLTNPMANAPNVQQGIPYRGESALTFELRVHLNLMEFALNANPTIL
jgi:hypothetical protein